MVDRKEIALNRTLSAINIIVSGQHGVYVPQVFAGFNLHEWSGIRSQDIADIEAGPESEWYWEAWDSILARAEYVLDGHTFRLHQIDGDLFAVCDELMDDYQFESFYGVSRETA